MKILIALPVYNEHLVLEKNLKQIIDFCRSNFKEDDFTIVIADNNSDEEFQVLGKRLADKISEVEYFYLSLSGVGNTKGEAWRQAFQRYEADIYIVMDIDLAVELKYTNGLVSGIKNGYDMVIGSRFLKESKVERSFFRDLTSIIYRLIARVVLGTKISDFQCGFKAVNQEVKNKVLSQTQDHGFFLDTELTYLTEKMGFKIKEVPVKWVEYPDAQRKSTVNVFKTAIDYLKKIWGLRRRARKISTKL